MQPTQIAEGLGITTRQQRKRVSLETHQGPGTPEVSDARASVICSHHVLRSKWEGNLLAMGLLERPLSGDVSLSSASQSKKATSCFPRPLTPRDRHEGRKQSSTVEAQKKAAPVQVRLGLKGRKEGRPNEALLAEPQSSRLTNRSPQVDRRQSMAFSILNTPKRLGNSLLRRGASKKTPAKVSPNTRSGTRRSPRIASTATPRAKGKVTQ